MTSENRVSVTMRGVTVGSAHVEEDGAIKLVFAGPSPRGREILDLISRGKIKELSFGPVNENLSVDVITEAAVNEPPVPSWLTPRRNFKPKGLAEKPDSTSV